MTRETSFRMLAFDLDGTLLERDGTLAEESARFLRELSGRGIELVAATGRRFWSALPHLEHAGLRGACVVHNGAMVADVARALPLHLRALEPDVVRKALAAMAGQGFSPLLFTAADRGPGEVLAQQGTEDPTGYRRWYFRYAAGHFTLHRQLSGAPLEGVLRLVTHGEPDALALLLHAVEQAGGGAIRGFVQRETTVPTWRAEFLSRAADKWSGVQWVAARLGIAPAQIVAVGDEANDVEMLAGAGLSLAAPGASDAARRAARERLEGDGARAVAHALERVFS